MRRITLHRPSVFAFLLVLAAAALPSVAILRSADASLVEHIRHGDLKGVDTGLGAGADVNMVDSTGATPLMHAAAVGSIATMRSLLEAGADVNATAGDGTTALMWATADANKVRLLLDRGSDINAKAKDGTTALVAAAQRGSADVVRLLLDRKADPMASGDGGALLFQAAFSTTSDEVRRVLTGAGLTPSHFGQIAPALGRVDFVDQDLVSRFLRVGGDPNMLLPMVTVRTPLLGYTAMVTGPDAVRLLLERGADANATSSRGVTPLMMAAASDHADPGTVRLLISHGAHVAALDDQGRSALDWAAMQGDTAVAALLREAGAPSTPIASSATTPLLAQPLPITTAVPKALGTLDTIGPAFYGKTGCISCHNQSLPAMARVIAATHGVTVEPAVASHSDQATLAMWTPRRNASFVGRCGGNGYVPTVTYGLASMAEEGTPSSSVTDSVAVCLASRQSPDGGWRVSDVRPPLSGSVFLYTALAVRSLGAYAPPALKSEMQRQIDRARSFLLNATPHDTQDESFKLMGLVWSQAPAAAIAAQTARVQALQRPDGGWGQTPLMTADAYATGQALYALHLAGTPVTRSHYMAGVRYLLRTQREDGSWFVQSRAFGFQPYAEYGFPHGKSQFLSAAATSWAVMALAPALGPAPQHLNTFNGVEHR